MAAFPFRIDATDGKARTGVLETARGPIRTPAFMPVGTAATVKALTVDQVNAALRKYIQPEGFVMGFGGDFKE